MNNDEQGQEEQVVSTGQAQEPAFYKSDDGQPDDSPQLPNVQPVSWTASEYIAHHKGVGWYAMLAILTVFAATLTYFFVEDILSIVAIVTVAIAFGFFGSRPPQTLQYVIDAHGITIGDKIYPYSILRTFSVQNEGAINCILLIPLKRFLPAISVYYPPDQEEQIINTLSSYLPHEERRSDPIERLMRHIRF